jgi:hypothetical protein
MAAAVLAQFPYRILALRWPDRVFLRGRTRRMIGNGLIALLVGNWILEVIGV